MPPADASPAKAAPGAIRTPRRQEGPRPRGAPVTPDPADSRAEAVAPPGAHRIVIVGGGAGGLELATTLGNKYGKGRRAHVTLVDKTRSHIWKPKLHEIAAGSMDVGIHEVDFLAQSHWHRFAYRIGEMTAR